MNFPPPKLLYISHMHIFSVTVIHSNTHTMHTHVCIHTHTHTQTHTHTHAHTHIHTHTQTHIHSHTYTHTHTHTHKHTYTHTHTHTHTRTHTHTNTHIQTHTRTHTHSRTHTHTCLERRGGTIRASLNFLHIFEVFVIHRVARSQDYRNQRICAISRSAANGKYRTEKKGTEPRLLLHPNPGPSRVTRPEFFLGVHPYTF